MALTRPAQPKLHRTGSRYRPHQNALATAIAREMPGVEPEYPRGLGPLARETAGARRTTTLWVSAGGRRDVVPHRARRQTSPALLGRPRRQPPRRVRRPGRHSALTRARLVRQLRDRDPAARGGGGGALRCSTATVCWTSWSHCSRPSMPRLEECIGFHGPVLVLAFRSWLFCERRAFSSSRSRPPGAFPDRHPRATGESKADSAAASFWRSIACTVGAAGRGRCLLAAHRPCSLAGTDPVSSPIARSARAPGGVPVETPTTTPASPGHLQRLDPAGRRAVPGHRGGGAAAETACR